MEDKHLIEDSRGEYNKEKDFTSLLCWQDAHKMKLFFYNDILPKIPYNEKDNLVIQIKKASISSTANIAEGYGRFHYQEGIQFYRISRGSIYELKDHLISCNSIGYVDDELLEKGIQLIESTKIKLNGYIKFVQNQKKKDKK